MALPIFNTARNTFIGLLNLPVNIVRAISGFVVGLDIFVFTCKIRFLRYLNRQGVHLDLLILYFALELALAFGLSSIIPWSPLLGMLIRYEFEILGIARLTFALTSLTLANIKKALQSIVNHPNVVIAAILSCALFPAMAISLNYSLLWLSSELIGIGLYAYLYEPQVPLLQLPLTFARKLSAVRVVEGYINFIGNTCYYFLQNNNQRTTFATYLNHINEDDGAYFFHNYFKREGKITLNAQDINDAQIAEFMQLLADKPAIAKYIKQIDLQNNNITSITIPSTCTALEQFNITGNKLKRIEFAEGLTNIKRVLLDDNYLKEVSIPETTLNTLQNLSLAGNPLTAATRYSLQQLPTRFPNLEISGLPDNETYAISEAILKEHVAALVPYSLQPPEHLNTISNEVTQKTFLLTEWMARRAATSIRKNYESSLCNKIISYLYAYPVTPQQAMTRISESLGMIIFSMPPPNRDGESDAIAACNNFAANPHVDGVAAQEFLDEAINKNFNAAIKRDVANAEKMLECRRTRLNMHTI